MSRANSRIDDLEELNRKLEQTINNLHVFANKLVGLGDKREVTKLGGAKSTERPRGAFFNEIEGALSQLAENLGYLDGLVNNLEGEVFDKITPAPGQTASKPFFGKIMPHADLGGSANA